MTLRPWIKFLLPSSLYGRALLIIVMPLILLQMISAWIFYDRHWERISWRLSVSIAGDIQNVMEQMRDHPDNLEVVFQRARRTMGLVMLFQPGDILPNSPVTENGPTDRMLGQVLREYVKRPFRIDSTSVEKEVVIDLQLAEGVLTTVVPIKRLFSSTTYIFILWMVGSSLALFAVASIFMRNQVRPIRRLARAVDSFGKGRDPGEDFKPEGALEVRQTAQAFNRMMERIRRQIRQRTDMLSGVSHDLKTPLTRMKLQLALLDKTPETEALRTNLTEMEQMIEGYLTFARGEGAEPSVETNLSALVQEVAEQWRQSGLSVDCHVEGEILCWIKPEALRRCLNNLLANANRYAEAVWLRAGRRGEFFEVLVDDNGPGIPKEQREDAFRPFSRLDRSRNPRTGGTGLGLAISRDMARVHGGDLLLEDSPHGGLRVRIQLPV